jgi:predicted ester cyclase
MSEFWGNPWNPEVIDELAAPDVSLKYSAHCSCRGRTELRSFATGFRAAFPDLSFRGVGDLVVDGDYVVARWEGGGTHAGAGFSARTLGPLPAGSGRQLRLAGTTIFRLTDGLISEEVGVYDGVSALRQLGLIPGASGDDNRSVWGQDRYGLADERHVLPQLAAVANIPAPPRANWRAAILTMFATNDEGTISAYVQHVQDLDWPVPERSLLIQAFALLYRRAAEITSK